MEIKLQPKKSRTCGAHCVAMVTGEKVEKVIELIGHKNGTNFRDISRVFKKLGYPNASKKVRTFFYQKELPKTCLIALKWKEKGGHWVVYNDGKIYCPGIGIYDYSLKNIDQQSVKAKHYLLIGEKAV